MSGPRSWLSSPIIRAMGGVGSAVVVGQLMGLAVSPIVSRLFTEEEFGLFGLFFGLTNVLAVIVLVGIPDALLVPDEEQDAQAVLRAGIVSISILTPVATVVGHLLVRGQLFGYGELPAWSWIPIFLEVAAVAFVMLLQIWLIRQTQFRILARGHITLGVFRAGGQVLAALLGFGFGGLAAAEVVSRVAVLTQYSRGAWMDLRAAMRVPIPTALEALWRVRLFPMFRLPSMIANNMGTAAPPALLTMAYDASTAGHFTLMIGVIAAPIGFVQKAVGDVFLGHFTTRYRTDPSGARRLLLKAMGGLALLATPPSILLYLAAPPLFVFVFGDGWHLAGVFASTMAVLFAAALTVGPLGGVLNATNRPDAKLVFDILRFGGLIATFVLCDGADPVVMVRGFAWTGVLAYAVYAVSIWLSARYPRAVSPRTNPKAVLD